MMDEDERLLNMIKQNNSDKIKQIFIENNKSKKQLIMELKSGIKESVELTNTQYEYNLSEKGIKNLEYILLNYQDELISCGEGYYTSGRDYYIFLYDLSMLCWLLEKLPDQFQLLKKIQSDGNELLHNRLITQLAFEYQKKFPSIEYEKDFQGSNPDLFINGVHIELKTILISMIDCNYQKFFDSFKREFQKAKQQIQNNGMIILAYWSKRINNEFREYFNDLIVVEIPEIKKGTTVLVVEGNELLTEHYICLPTNQTLDLVKNFCDHGHTRVNPMAYLTSMMRNGFPRQNTSSDGFMMYRMG